MKKAVSKILPAAVAVLLLSLSVLAGCGGSAPGTLDGTTWDIVTVKVNGENIDANAELAAEGYSGSVSMEFHDGVVTTSGLGQQITYPYTYENGQGNIGSDVRFTVSAKRKQAGCLT